MQLETCISRCGKKNDFMSKLSLQVGSTVEIGFEAAFFCLSLSSCCRINGGFLILTSTQLLAFLRVSTLSLSLNRILLLPVLTHSTRFDAKVGQNNQMQIKKPG